MKTITAEELKKVIERHGEWLRDEKGGERAELGEMDLRGADLTGACLCFADLRYADLRVAGLTGADLTGVITE